MEALQRFFGIKRQRQQERAATEWDRYRKLLQDFTDGVEVDVDEADEIMAAVGRDENQLQADIETYQKRLAARKQIDIAKEAEIEERKLGAELSDLHAQLNALQEKLGPKIEELSRQYEAASNRKLGGAYAERTLQATVMDPYIGEREESLKEKLKELGERHRELESYIRDCGEQYALESLKNYRLLDDHGSHAEHIARAEQRLEIARNRAAPMREKLADLDAEMIAIRKEIGDLEQRKLEP